MTYAVCWTHQLDADCQLHEGRLPEELLLSNEAFDRLWEQHPDRYHVIMIHGRPVRTPRWQQAYGQDYHYTGQVNGALPIPGELEPYLSWCREHVDDQLNGLLLNWYDGRLGHYIGPHRDSTTNIVQVAPIVTISFGEERVFRLRPWKGKGFRDFAARHGSVFVMSFRTNARWTHEVPCSKKATGRRISVTLRAFR